jgi:hydroxyacylglutathione hydrolase
MALFSSWQTVSKVYSIISVSSRWTQAKEDDKNNRMKIKKHLVGLLLTNCYLVWDEDTMDAFIIDPGYGAKKLINTIEEKKVNLKAIIHTHSHIDHVGASKKIQKKTGAPIHRHPADMKNGMLHKIKKADGKSIIDLADGQELQIGNTTFQVILTPGHSPGSVILYADGIMFGGDLLFQGSAGRPDLKGGSFRELVKSLNERIAHLPDSTRVLPGHGEETTLGIERMTNPFFKSARKAKQENAK